MGAHVTPQKKLAVLQDIMAGQLTRLQLAATNGVSVSTVDRMREAYRKRNGKTLAELAGIKNGATPATPITQRARTPMQQKNDKLSEAILGLRASGFSVPQIAAQLKISKGTVNYHTYIRPKQMAKKGTQAIVAREAQSQNGGQISGINKHVFVGIYVAEAERLGHHIGERFGVSSDFLRSGLSEFLEYTKIRRTPRHGD